MKTSSKLDSFVAQYITTKNQVNWKLVLGEFFGLILVIIVGIAALALAGVIVWGLYAYAPWYVWTPLTGILSLAAIWCGIVAWRAKALRTLNALARSEGKSMNSGGTTNGII